MLCRRCRCRLVRGAAVCDACGEPLSGESPPPLELVLPDGTRVALVGALELGRGAASDVQLADPTVSRRHARIDGSGPFPMVEDLGSSYGTLLDERPLQGKAPLRDGAVLVLGDCELRVERAREHHQAGHTIVVRAGQTVVLDANGTTEIRSLRGQDRNRRPKLRSGYALKRLDASEGARRWVLKDDRDGNLVRMGDGEAELLGLLDGRRDIGELVAEAEQRLGAGGAARLAALVAELGERGLLSGVDAAPARKGLLARALQPRQLVSTRLAGGFATAYRRGGWILFTTPVLLLLAAVAVGGAAAWVYLIAGRYGTPFVVAERVGLGGLIFILGRFVVVALHELAHGLTAASFGRRVPRAGFKLLLVFPYAFVDTSDAWFEPRSRRMAISAAGPASDMIVGGGFALCALATGGNVRAVFFQLALAAYVGAFFNLNPLIDRDGYQLLVDALREPGLRRRSRERLSALLAGRPRPAASSRALVTYALASLGWSLSLVGFAILVPVLYWDRLTKIQSPEVIVGVLVVVYALMLLPVALVVGRPLLSRFGGREARAAG
jgi:putative peptide zinc metalloprotease protein